MNDTRDTLVDTVRRNPIPAALAGIGIAWLLMNRSSSNRGRSAAPNGGGFNPYRGMDYGPGGGREGGMAAVGDALSGAQHAVTDAASKKGVNGTPTVFVDNREVKGTGSDAVTTAQVNAAITTALAGAKSQAAPSPTPTATAAVSGTPVPSASG